MERKGFKSAVLHDELEPGSQLRGGALETAGIDSESLAEGSGECKSFKSSAEGNGKRIGNLEARSGIEPPMRVLQTHALPLGYRAIRSYAQHIRPGNERPTCQGFRRWATISAGWT